MAGLDGNRAILESGIRPEPPETMDDDAIGVTESTAMPEQGDLGSFVKDKATSWMAAKRDIEDEWFQDILDWKGEYSSKALAEIRRRPNRSEVFVKLPMSVCNAAKSLIINLLFDGGSLPWDILPTANPEMEAINTKALMEAVEVAASQLPPEVQGQFKEENNFERAIAEEKEAAQTRANLMRLDMTDHIQEMHLDEAFMRGLDPYTIMGTMVFQGPRSVKRRPRRWVKQGNTWKAALTPKGGGTESDNGDIRPDFKLLNNWSCYPDPVARHKDEADGVLVRHILSRHAFIALKDDGCDSDAVDRALARFETKGNWVAQWWESGSTTSSGDDSNTEPRQHRFEVYELHHWMDGRMLRHYGIEVDDADLNNQVMVEIWTVDDIVLKLVVSNKEPASLDFFFVPYATVDGRIWGWGAPRQMSDSTQIYNGAERAKLDNMRVSAGLQIVVDRSRLVRPGDADEIYPDKVWEVDDMTGLSLQPITFFQPANNVQQMRGIQDAVRWHVQKETNLPDFAMGIPGSPSHNRTAEGLTIQKDLALGFIRTVITNIDTYGIKPMMRALYDWEMNFNPNDEVKGDYEIVAKGAANALDDFGISQSILGLMNSPLGKEYVKVDKAAPLLNRKLKLDEYDLIRTDAEVQARREQDAMLDANKMAAATRMQPEVPQKNAIMDFLGKADPKTAIYGPALQAAANVLGIMDDKMAAAIDMINEINARNGASLLSQADLAAMQTDINAAQTIADHTSATAQMAKASAPPPPPAEPAMPQNININIPPPPPPPAPKKPGKFRFIKQGDAIVAEPIEEEPIPSPDGNQEA